MEKIYAFTFNGHNATVIKPECGHHTHSLDDVTSIVEFIENA